MNAPARVGAFVAALGLSFGAAALAGGAIDSLRDPTEPAHGDMPSAHDPDRESRPGDAHAEPGHDAAGDSPAASRNTPGGLAVSAEGLTLDVATTTLSRNENERFRFRIVGGGGTALRAFEEQHERRMHLIIVRRDLTGYQHLHPTLAPDGTWTTPLRLPTAGVYRAYADFVVDGRKRTLATDLLVAGPFTPRALPAPTATVTTGGGDVTLGGSRPRAGARTEVKYAVSRGGRPVADLQPYLGAKGHLVALREGDLAYLHVHPENAGADEEIVFAATFPSPGRYRLFLQFRRGGRVETAAHTVEVAR